MRLIGMTTATLYCYVNGDDSVKAAGKALLDQNNNEQRKDK